jgi:hypothetical protein
MKSALARAKHGRSYLFFPLEKIAKMYHVSGQFAGAGLRGLVELGIMRVMQGQFGRQAPNNEFDAANRYYFEGLGAIQLRQWQFEDLKIEYGTGFEPATSLGSPGAYFNVIPPTLQCSKM